MTVGKAGSTDPVKAHFQRQNAPLAANLLLTFNKLDEAGRQDLKARFTAVIDRGELAPAFGELLKGLEARPAALLQGRFDALASGMQKLSQAVASTDEAYSETYQMGRPGRLSPEVKEHNVALVKGALAELDQQFAALDAAAAAGKLTPDEVTFLEGAKYIAGFKKRTAEYNLQRGL
jgi:hypothetical protein